MKPEVKETLEILAEICSQAEHDLVTECTDYEGRFIKDYDLQRGALRRLRHGLEKVLKGGE